MSDNHTTGNIPTWFWILSALALVWDLMGIMAFFQTVTMSPATLATMSQAEQELYHKTPAWTNIVFAIATIGSMLGCIALLFRKAFATTLFIISFIAILIQMGYAFFMVDSFDGFGPGGILMPVMITVVGLLLIFFSKKATEKGWIN